MSEAILNLVVNSKGVPEANDGLGKLSDNASRAEKSAKGLTSTMGMLSGALGALGISLGVMAVKNAADSWSDMTARLGLAVGGAEKATAVMQRLQAVARNTYSDINTTTESFIANAGVLRDLGKSTAQALDYTEALNNALVVSGAKAETAASVQEAMSRAMALGKLSGDQLNTVIAKGGEVASVLAAELGVSTLQLRKLGQDGKITGDVIFNALTKRVDELREKAGEMPATMQDAATAWSNAFTTIVGTVDQAIGSSGALGQALYDLGVQVGQSAGTIAQVFVSMQMVAMSAFTSISGALNTVMGDFDATNALIIAGSGLAATALVGLAATIMGPVIGAFAALTAAIMANPLGLLIGAFAAVTTAAYLFRDEISEILGVNVIAEARNSANIVIGVFVAAYQTVIKYWENLPQAFAIIGKKAWNAFVSSIEGESLWVEAFGQKFTLFDGIDLSKFKADITGEAQGISADLDNIWKTEMSKDWVGEVSQGLDTVWKKAGEVTQQFDNMNAALNGDAGPGMGGALDDGSSGGGGKSGKGKGGKDEKSRAAERLARDMEQRFEVLKEAHQSEEEYQLEKYAKDLETLQWHLDQKKITEEEFLEWKERVTRDHEATMQQIRAAGFADSLTATGEFFGALAGAMGSGNEKMLRAQKAFAAAGALVNAYLAASQVLADPKLGFFSKFAAVAAVLAKGMALVSAIKSGSNSASGGGSSGSTSQAASPQQSAPLRQMAKIDVHGEVFTREQVINLIEKINDVQKDGHVISWSTA
ncbi:tape measure protein [Brucellaceae bacterium C25G]